MPLGAVHPIMNTAHPMEASSCGDRDPPSADWSPRSAALSNGHVYLTLKDERAAIDGVVWKGSVRGLSVRPEQGLEVIVTGKITSYPAGSRYQIVIETMEAAGVGALLAQLERLKARLGGE